MKKKFIKFCKWLAESRTANFEMTVLSTFALFWLMVILCIQLHNKVSDSVLTLCVFGSTYLVCRWKTRIICRDSYNEGVCDTLQENSSKIRECMREITELKSELESKRKSSRKRKTD